MDKYKEFYLYLNEVIITAVKNIFIKNKKILLEKDYKEIIRILDNILEQQQNVINIELNHNGIDSQNYSEEYFREQIEEELRMVLTIYKLNTNGLLTNENLEEILENILSYYIYIVNSPLKYTLEEIEEIYANEC